MGNDFRRSSFVNLREILSSFDWLHVHKCENRNGHDLCNSYWCHDCTKLSESLKMYHIILDRSEKLTENQNAKKWFLNRLREPYLCIFGTYVINVTWIKARDWPKVRKVTKIVRLTISEWREFNNQLPK